MNTFAKLSFLKVLLVLCLGEQQLPASDDVRDHHWRPFKPGERATSQPRLRQVACPNRRLIEPSGGPAQTSFAAVS